MMWALVVHMSSAGSVLCAPSIVKEEGGTSKADKTEKKKEGSVKKEAKQEVKEDMISSVKNRRVMAMQAKLDKEEQDRQNKGEQRSGCQEAEGKKGMKL